MRFDSGYWTNKTLKWLFRLGISFTMAVRTGKALDETIAAIDDSACLPRSRASHQRHASLLGACWWSISGAQGAHLGPRHGGWRLTHRPGQRAALGIHLFGASAPGHGAVHVGHVPARFCHRTPQPARCRVG